MAQKVAIISTLLVALSMLLFFIGLLGSNMQWFYSNGFVVGSGIAVFVFTAVLICVLPYYEGR